MTKKQRALIFCEALEKLYPDAECSLVFSKPYELMIAARLSAQCTDARVNIVTQSLFKKYPTLEAFACASLEELEQDIKPCGFYHTKAKNIIEMANQILDNFSGEIPQTMDELLTISGIGRKTANLLLGDIYKKPAIVTDTHFIRITGRIGLTLNKDPKKVEEDLVKLIPPEVSSDFCHRIVQFGRDVCIARKPKCDICSCTDFCKYYSGNNKTKK